MEDRQILLCVGPPANGKSTWSKDFVKNNENWIRVNRDDLLRSIWIGYKRRPKFKEIHEIELDIARDALECGFNVVVDDTNMNIDIVKAWRDLAKEMHSCIKYKKFLIPKKRSYRTG